MSPLATWVGPFDALMSNMSVLRVGEKYEISDAQAESGHWEVDTPEPAPAPAPSPSISTPSTSSAGTDS